MRILWVKAGGLLPPDTGGKIRSYNILRELAKRQHAITVFTFYAAEERERNADLAKQFERAICIPMPMPKKRGAREFAAYVGRAMSLEPYGIAKFSRLYIRNALLQVLREGAYDVLVCDFLAAAGVVPWDWPCAKVLFSHNVEAAIWKRHFDTARGLLWKALSWREWKTVERAERRYMTRADYVLTVSESDRQSFLRFIPPERILAVPTGVDSDYFKPAPGVGRAASILFTGSMDWIPNEDAIFYFVCDVLPLIRERIPQASLTVVGKNPSPRLQTLALRDPAIRLTGWVEDVRPFMDESSVCIVPLRIGGGTRIKIYEAMAMGKAVVSTAIGAEGLPVSDGANILIADEPAAFAQAVTGLLNDAERRVRLGAAARRFVCDSYSWTTVARIVSQALEEAQTHVRTGQALTNPSSLQNAMGQDY